MASSSPQKDNNGPSKPMEKKEKGKMNVKEKEKESQSRISMFDVAQGKTRERILLQRLIVIAGLPQQLTDSKDLGAHNEKLILHLRRRYRWDHITGLLLLYPSCMIHIVESSRDVLGCVLKDLTEQQQSDGTPISSILLETPKVMFMAHDPPGRLFQQWSYKVLTWQTSILGVGPKEETTETLVCTVLSMLRKLGGHPEISKKTLPGSVLEEAPELIVPQKVLVELLARKELLSPQQYLQMYYSPLNIVMDSERVWPPAKHVAWDWGLEDS